MSLPVMQFVITVLQRTLYVGMNVDSNYIMGLTLTRLNCYLQIVHTFIRKSGVESLTQNIRANVH